jgi:biopolymer transport protein ExbD
MKHRRDPFSVVQTPMVDMAFNLVLFFVISLVIVPEDLVPLKLPTNYAEGKPDIRVGDEMLFHVLRNGAVMIEDQLLADSAAQDTVVFARTDTLLAQYKAANPDGKVIVKADSGAVWSRPLQVLQAAGNRGVPISIAMTPDYKRPLESTP